MKTWITNIGYGLGHILLPHCCAGCGTDQLGRSQLICLFCQLQLPLTAFERYANNPVEKIFFGRLPLWAASSHYYFTKQSVLQKLLHQLKYRGNRKIGYYFGRQMGLACKSSKRFDGADGVLALPLHPKKEKLRGYNQADLLCQGFAETSGIPFLRNAVQRNRATATQTRKSRLERWQNMEGRFSIKNHTQLENKKLILIDDVVTTGATLEACGEALLQVKGLELAILTLAYTAR